MTFGSGFKYGSGTYYAGSAGGGGPPLPPPPAGSEVSVALGEKHNSYIAYAFQYRDDKGDLVWEKRLLTFDPDLIAHVRSISVDFLEDGEVIPYFAGDEDSVRIYYEIELNATAADPTTGSSYVDAQSGSPASTGVFANLGDRISIKARGQTSAGVLGPVLAKTFVRGDSIYTAPRFRVRATRSGDTITVTIDGEDPSASMTAWDFSYSYPNGAGGTSSATNSTAWTTNGWSLGTRTWTSTKQLTVSKGVTGQFSFRATFQDEKGVSREKGDTIALENIDQVTKEITLPASGFIPYNDSTTWQNNGGTLDPNRAVTTSTYRASLVLPPGAIITAFVTSGKRASTGSSCDFWLSYITFSGFTETTNMIANNTHGVDASNLTTVTTSALAHTFVTARPYVVQCTLFSNTGVSDAALSYAKIVYDVPSYEKTI